MTKILESVHDFVWGTPALVLLLGVGLYLTVLTGFVQLRRFSDSFHMVFGQLRQPVGSGVSAMQGLCTALAATVGTGNVAGVAGAICLGGPGAVFWMWLCGLLGMATKYAEVTLAVRYRVRQGSGYVGGPMYFISRGMKCPWLGRVYAALGLLACFGVGNFAQVNVMVSGLNFLYGPDLSPWLVGFTLALFTGITLVGGMEHIGRTAEALVPGAAMVYLFLCVWVLVARAGVLPQVFRQILVGAFSPRAATGGLVGSLFVTLRTGCSRGVFSNEAGMGTTSMAHASVQSNAEQGLMGIVEVFLDTMVICTMTALAILSSGLPIPYGQDLGAELTEAAFSGVLGRWSDVVLTGSLCCFAYATILGWSVYGAVCAGFLFGQRAVQSFYLLQSCLVIVGAVLPTQTVWQLCETLNGAMAVPNLIALTALSPELKNRTYKLSGSSAASGGTYANIHQCKPL